MEFIEIKTLVDITNTEKRRSNQGTQVEVNQYKNWVTLLQCLGLRSVISYDVNPQCNIEKIDGKFGKEYSGSHKVWSFKFVPDSEEAYRTGSDPVGLLKFDIDKVPIISGLQESINIDKDVFNLFDQRTTNLIVTVI